MKSSELLEKAKKYLWDGIGDETGDETGYAFICYAILHAASTPSQIGLAQKVRDAIEVRLHPWNNLHSWLRYEAGIPEKMLTQERVQAHRLAWMNKLIKEYKAKGD